MPATYSLTHEELGRLLRTAFHRGVAYGADGVHPEPGQSPMERRDDLFCDAVPGFEAAIVRDREKDAASRDWLAMAGRLGAPSNLTAPLVAEPAECPHCGESLAAAPEPERSEEEERALDRETLADEAYHIQKDMEP